MFSNIGSMLMLLQNLCIDHICMNALWILPSLKIAISRLSFFGVLRNILFVEDFGDLSLELFRWNFLDIFSTMFACVELCFVCVSCQILISSQYNNPIFTRVPWWHSNCLVGTSFYLSNGTQQQSSSDTWIIPFNIKSRVFKITNY